MPKHVSLRGNHRLFLIKAHWGYFQHNELVHTLNVNKILRKEDQVLDFWVTDELAASKIRFCKYLEYVSPDIMQLQKTKDDKSF